MKHNVMLVDDCSNVLHALNWILSDEPYRLYSFENPVEALSELTATEFAVVIADQIMPELKGIELIERVKAESPQTVGIVISGDDELKSSINKTDQKLVYRFIEKPWNVKELKQVVKEAIACYESTTACKTG